MREDDSNWFSNWEHELPSPDELVPLSQTLISPDLAIAFGIKLIPDSQNPNPPLFPSAAHTTTPNSAESDSPEPAPAAAGDDYARAVKRPRLVWTPQLHKRFVDAVAQLGIKNAVPKTIMQLMSVDGLTRENVASHLQKYRLYLKRMQGGSSGAGWLSSSGDPATDHLFSTSPVPALFLQQQNRDNILPFSPPPQHHQQLQQPHYRQVGKYGSGLNGHLDHSFLMGQSQPGHRIRSPVYNSGSVGYNGEEEEAGDAANGRRVLTLFPTGGDD